MKAKVLAKTNGLSREEWLALRRHGIGSSDAPAVCGLDPYRKPIQVYMDKLGLEPDRPSNEAAEWGRLLEDLIAAEFARRTGKKVRRLNAIFQSREHPFMIAEPDRELPGRALLEIKTTGLPHKREWDNDQVPERVMVQVQHQLVVMGAERAFVACLVGGQELLIREVWPDRQLQQALVDIERRFWFEHVAVRVPPPPDDSEAYSRAMAALYPGEAGKTVELPDSARELIVDYLMANRAIREWEARKRAAQNALESMLGNATVGLLDGRPAVRWTRYRTQVLDTTALREAHPDIAAAFTREELRQRFAVVMKGDE